METAGSVLTAWLQLHICACVEIDVPPFFSVKLDLSCSYKEVSSTFELPVKSGELLDDNPKVCLKRLKITLVEKQPWSSGVRALSF